MSDPVDRLRRAAAAPPLRGDPLAPMFEAVADAVVEMRRLSSGDDAGRKAADAVARHMGAVRGRIDRQTGAIVAALLVLAVLGGVRIGQWMERQAPVRTAYGTLDPAVARLLGANDLARAWDRREAIPGRPGGYRIPVWDPAMGPP